MSREHATNRKLLVIRGIAMILKAPIELRCILVTSLPYRDLPVVTLRFGFIVSGASAV